jgi:hypothetical protein
MGDRSNSDWHLDEGKPRVDLIPVLSLIELGKVMDYGSKKYGQHNWSKHAGRWDWTQLTASALRHLYAWMMGEDNDKESGLNHLAHVLANITMLLDLQIMGRGEDDRNPVYQKSIAQYDPRVLEPNSVLDDSQYDPNEEPHELTFPQFAPEVARYWDNELARELQSTGLNVMTCDEQGCGPLETER